MLEHRKSQSIDLHDYDGSTTLKISKLEPRNRSLEGLIRKRKKSKKLRRAELSLNQGIKEASLLLNRESSSHIGFLHFPEMDSFLGDLDSSSPEQSGTLPDLNPISKDITTKVSLSSLEDLAFGTKPPQAWDTQKPKGDKKISLIELRTIKRHQRRYFSTRGKPPKELSSLISTSSISRNRSRKSVRYHSKQLINHRHHHQTKETLNYLPQLTQNQPTLAQTKLGMTESMTLPDHYQSTIGSKSVDQSHPSTIFEAKKDYLRRTKTKIFEDGKEGSSISMRQYGHQNDEINGKYKLSKHRYLNFFKRLQTKIGVSKIKQDYKKRKGAVAGYPKQGKNLFVSDEDHRKMMQRILSGLKSSNECERIKLENYIKALNGGDKINPIVGVDENGAKIYKFGKNMKKLKRRSLLRNEVNLGLGGSDKLKKKFRKIGRYASRLFVNIPDSKFQKEEENKRFEVMSIKEQRLDMMGLIGRTQRSRLVKDEGTLEQSRQYQGQLFRRRGDLAKKVKEYVDSKTYTTSGLLNMFGGSGEAVNLQKILE